MKKTINTLFLSAALILAVSINSSFAQTSNISDKIDVGAELAYGTKSDVGIGIGVNGYYTINQNIRAGLDIIYYLGTPDYFNFWELNLNGQYLFDVDGTTITPYALAGLNISTSKVDLGKYGSASDINLGLNLGGGAEYPVSFGAVFAELKYVVSDYDQLVISAGVRIGI